MAALSAGVALGTLYRYFPSKTHLFVGVMADRVESMRAGIRRRSTASGTPADRVFDVLARATRTMLRQPHLGAPMLNSLNAADGAVVAEVGQIDQQVRRMLLDARVVNKPNPQQISLVRLVQQTGTESCSPASMGACPLRRRRTASGRRACCCSVPCHQPLLTARARLNRTVPAPKANPGQPREPRLSTASIRLLCEHPVHRCAAHAERRRNRAR